MVAISAICVFHGLRDLLDPSMAAYPIRIPPPAQAAPQMGRADAVRQLRFPPGGWLVAKSSIPYLPVFVSAAEKCLLRAFYIRDLVDSVDT